jgi:hypothetical protein
VLPGPAAFDAYDGFVRSLGFLSGTELCALIVAGDEIMDNLLTHGEIGPSGVTVLVRKRASGLTLAFFVDSHRQFAEFSSCLDADGPSGLRYDEGARRWRGLGLTMCRNIASAVRYRPGRSVDRIFLTFAGRF